MTITLDRRRTDLLAPLLLGLVSAAIALLPGPAQKALLVVPLVAAAVLWWLLLKPSRWLLLFFPVLLLTPPLPFPLGDAGIHLAPALALAGIFAGVLRLRDWRPSLPPLAVALCAFCAILLISSGVAAIYSGAVIAVGSLMRVGLFSIGVYVFLYALRGPRGLSDNPLALIRYLFIVAVIAASFACVDYYYQFPAPAGFEPQYVWLDEGVLRRAQGLFYEASTLGNFCAFFLVTIAVALFRPRAQSPCSKLLLALGAIVFGAALILSYSRASVLNVLVACVAFAFLRRGRVGKAVVAAGVLVSVAVFAVVAAAPSFFASYWHRLSASVGYLWYSPDGVLSGRLTHWRVVLDFLAREPWHAIFGVGYKTLPYSTFIGTTVITDNTWLSLLAETGIVGLTAFAAFNILVLRSGLRAARSLNPRAAFLGEWIFCFWAGELAQMFSGDLITYWRVLPIYFWVLGAAVRECEETP